MKRSSTHAAAAVAVASLLAARPAFAQPYDDVFGPAFGMFFLFCWGVFALVGLALLVLNIWMLVDVIQREEHEFPGSTGNSKTLWLVLLIVGLLIGFGWIVAIIYYFQVYKKIKRGSAGPAGPSAQAPPPAAPPPAAPPPSAPAPPPAAPPPSAPPPPVAPPPTPDSETSDSEEPKPE